MLLINGLAKVANDSIVQGAGPDVVIGIGGYEDRRNCIPRTDEVSSPVIAGIWTSAIKQAVSTRRGDARKSAADGKASTLQPSDLMSLVMDSRKN
jgi:hypothetical protein